MPGDDIVTQLQAFPAFAALARPHLEKVAALARERSYRPGMFVLVEGEPVEAVYFIRSGFVKATRTGADGREQIISVLGPGDFFPHVGFLDAGPAPGTVHTLSPVAVAAIHRADFVRLVRDNSEVALSIISMLAKRIRLLQNQLVAMGIKSVPARLAGLILEMASPGAVGESQHPVINVHLSRQELAAMIGATRETVSRTLSDFRRAGMIDFQPDGSIVIVDAATLKRLAGGP